jgi:hypothetical protein
MTVFLQAVAASWTDSLPVLLKIGRHPSGMAVWQYSFWNISALAPVSTADAVTMSGHPWIGTFT